ncbi:MAG: glycogen debranching enzyme family protein [Chloroflexi bacterium]|nr:glycogen debranching enzyme family protein [Chloroflexota bacterium]
MATVELARDRWPTLDAALEAEWLVTNGLGGYASSTVVGANTRRYHGLLVAALKPPVGRTALLSKLEEELEVEKARYTLSASEYHDGAIAQGGYQLLRSVRFEGSIPTFVFQAGRAVLEKTVWMARERNTTYVRYTLREAPVPAVLHLRPLVTHREFHSLTQGARAWRFSLGRARKGYELRASPTAAPLRLWVVPHAGLQEQPDWYWRFLYRQERQRGLDCLEDLYTPGVFTASLAPGASLTVVASAEPPEDVDLDAARAWDLEKRRQATLLRQAGHSPGGAPALGPQKDTGPSTDSFPARLALAADQFLVRRPSAGPGGRTAIAGYHWFGDWGRDTMISLPGLCLATGRHEEARAILRGFAQHIDQGLLPNRFPEAGEPPEYTAADATLWCFPALGAYLRSTQDKSLLLDIYVSLEEVISWHRRGTRYGIAVDPSDGLLKAGTPGVPLTWMDARVDGWVVTSRWGKPVEINALWYNALMFMAKWTEEMSRDSTTYQEQADIVRESFNRRFWYGNGGYLYDVVDGEEGDDPSLRPNQLLAISLPYPVLDRHRWPPVLDAVRSQLLTPYGLRTLAPDHPRYKGRYEGDQRSRDDAYHQGTVWPWLLGAYVDALLRVQGDASAARQALQELPESLWQAGMGSLSEVFDGDPPHTARGCIAQAWSVAEVLRAWLRTEPSAGPWTGWAL